MDYKADSHSLYFYKKLVTEFKKYQVTLLLTDVLTKQSTTVSIDFEFTQKLKLFTKENSQNKPAANFTLSFNQMLETIEV